METRTRSASPVSPITVDPVHTPPSQDKISAYYSLVFPHFTFYIQTLSITIGRRCAPNQNAATTSTTELATVDVDLGALKSVSRLHAKIEFDQDADCFILVVVGRNGAWVDGVWSGSGSRAPLGERSQIQIASRIFHFLLPPPPPPEDTPSPSSQSSNNRQRSPSVDITSISPPSSQPSHTPPPSLKPTSPIESQTTPSLLPSEDNSAKLPNSNLIGRPKKTATSKKRKKLAETLVSSKLKLGDMPPKPPFTYAQLIYKAIKAIGEKATLQEICAWIMNTYDHYRYTDASWMSSIRHNLSSNRAFKKLERCGGDRGKGFFWKLDEEHSQTLEEQEARVSSSAASNGATDGQSRGRKKDKGIPLEPALKRSIKGDFKGTPLPPPLTSAPLQMKNPIKAAMPTATLTTQTTPAKPNGTTSPTTGIFAYPTHPHHSQVAKMNESSSSTSGYSNSTAPAHPYTAWAMHPMSNANVNPYTSTTSAIPSTSTHGRPVLGSASTATSNHAQSLGPPPFKSPPTTGPLPDVSLPIILGPIPSTHPDYSPIHPHNSAKEGYMILHEQKLILDPDVFGGLTVEMLQRLEKMGTMAALQVLKDHMVKSLKERRAKGRGRIKRPRGTGRKTDGSNTVHAEGLSKNVPLEQESGVLGQATQNTGREALSSIVLVATPVTQPVTSDTSADAHEDPGTPIVVVDDSDDDKGPAAKRRKVDDA